MGEDAPALTHPLLFVVLPTDSVSECRGGFGRLRLEPARAPWRGNAQ